METRIKELYRYIHGRYNGSYEVGEDSIISIERIPQVVPNGPRICEYLITYKGNIGNKILRGGEYSEVLMTPGEESPQAP